MANTTSNARASQAHDRKFAHLVNRMAVTGELPTDDEILEAGTWLDILVELVDAMKQDGEAGFYATKTALMNNNPRMAALLATAAEDQDQEELHPDLKIGKKGKKVYVTLTEDDIECFPDAIYLVSGILQTATVSMLFGESNTGKTFVALHTAQCIARGMQWLGRPVEQGPVLYIYAEGKLGLKPRLQAWRKHYSLPKTSNVQYIAHPVHLLSDRQTLIDTIEDQEVKPVLVVIDTFSNCSIGTNQNDQMEVAKILATGHDIARDYGSHVMVVHHTNRAGTVNGSAAFRNHVDTMIELSRDGKDGPLTMKCEKQRDASFFSDIRLNLAIIDLGLNEKTFEQITSCVIMASCSPAAESAMPHTEQKMLELLALQGRISYNTWKKACEGEKIAKGTAFYAHVNNLLNQGRVKKTEEGPGKRTWYEALNDASSTSSTSSQPVHPNYPN